MSTIDNHHTRMFEEGTGGKKKTRVDSDITLVWMKYLSDKVVQLLMKTPITPNQITLGNFLIFAPLVSYFLVRGGYLFNFLALGALVMSSFLDLMDGEMVRQGKPSSKLGIWFEASLDPLIQSVVIFSIALYVLIHIGADWKYLALLPLFGQGFANSLGLTLHNTFKIDPLTGHQTLNQGVEASTSWVDFLARNIMVPTHGLFVFLFTLRFHMIIGIFLNKLHYTFIIFGVFIVIRALAIYIILCLHYADKDLKLNKYAVFRYLHAARNQLLM